MPTDQVQINLPQTFGETAATIANGRIAFAKLEADPFQTNPQAEFDGFGIFHSFSPRHSNFIEESEYERVKADPDTVVLSYYEHSASLWFVRDDPEVHVPDRQWDCRDYAGFWEADGSVKAEADAAGLLLGSPERRAFMTERAKSSCEVYTEWCNGWVKAYTVTAYDVRLDEDAPDFPLDDESDYEDADPVEQDSCGGIYGDEHAKELIAEAVHSALGLVEDTNSD